ncbi:MAG: methionyl-tRNA formyltransferase [Oscillospiraceae bacterium]
MGTPYFAKESLKKLIEEKHNILAVFTQPDKKSGRGKKVKFSPVKEFALSKDIPVHQPLKLRDEESVKQIKKYNPDIIVVVAYGQILSEEILGTPKHGCLNIHGSLLPKYRGASPIQTSIINGDKKTGVTIMYMDKGLDTGDIILSKEINIELDDTSESLFSKLSKLGAECICEVLYKIKESTVTRSKQNEGLATYTTILNKTMGNLNFSKDAIDLHNLIMGLNPWPLAYTTFNNKKLKVFKSKIIENDCNNKKCGIITSNKKFVVSCGNNTAIEFLEVLIEGGKKMSGESFIVGRNIKADEIFVGDQL